MTIDPIGRRRLVQLGALFATGTAVLSGTEASAAKPAEPDAAGRQRKVPAEDKLAIIELMAHYAWAYDTAHVDAFVNTFTEDGELYIFGHPVGGRAAIPAFLQGAFEARKDNGWQHLTDHHVFRDYDGRRCTVYSFYLMPEADPNGGNGRLRAMGYYTSHCVKMPDGEWLFARRDVSRWNSKRPW